MSDHPQPPYGIKDIGYVISQAATDRNYRVVKQIDASLRNNLDFWTTLILTSKDLALFNLVPNKIKNQREFITLVSASFRNGFSHFSDKVKDDPEIVKSVIVSWRDNFLQASKRLRSDLEFVREVMKIESLIYTDLEPNMKADPICISYFLAANPRSIKQVQSHFITKEHCLSVIETDGYNFSFLPLKMKVDLEIAKAALTSAKPICFLQLPESLTDNKDLALVYLSNSGLSDLSGFDPKLLDDYEIMSLAVQKNSSNYEQGSNRIKSNIHIMKLALEAEKFINDFNSLGIITLHLNKQYPNNKIKLPTYNKGEFILDVVNKLIAEELHAELKQTALKAGVGGSVKPKPASKPSRI